MDVEISPEPSEAERAAILRALELEVEGSGEPSPWQRSGLEPEETEGQATTPPRQSRGATRA